MEYHGMFDFFYGRESERLNFITIPKILLKDPRFRRVSSEAKILYGCLLDRNSLSQKNGWLDEKNRVYVVYTIQEMKEDLCCATEKISKVLKELETIGLIFRKRNGRGMANHIYVMDYMAIYRKEGGEEFRFPKNKDFDYRKSRVSDSENPGFRLSKANKTDKSITDKSNSGAARQPYKNSFCNFPQNDYDFAELERILLGQADRGE